MTTLKRAVKTRTLDGLNKNRVAGAGVQQLIL